MRNFLVCFGCNGHDYLTRVTAVTLAGAEHVILDMGVTGKHTCGVSYSQAFDGEGIKTDTFVGLAISASPVTLDDARKIIERFNAVIRLQDAREKRIADLTAQINAMENELAGLRSEPAIPF